MVAPIKKESPSGFLEGERVRLLVGYLAWTENTIADYWPARTESHRFIMPSEAIFYVGEGTNRGTVLVRDERYAVYVVPVSLLREPE